MVAQLKRATRQKVKMRMSIASPTGFGKTHSALLLAYGMTGDWEKIALIDSENGSGDLYADLGPYNTLTLQPPFKAENYIEAIKECEDAGMEVIIIDSATHVWTGKGGLLEFKDSLGGRFQDWAQVTPLYQNWLNAILHSKCHTIVTMRKKQGYSMTMVNGTPKVEKVGLEDQIRDGFDYEMTIALEIINDAHLTQASKDRTRLFAGKPAFVITPETGRDILEWCEIGEGIDRAVDEAIAKLAKCDTHDEMTLLKETLPMMVRVNERFRGAGKERFAQLTSAPTPNSSENTPQEIGETNSATQSTNSNTQETPAGSDASTSTSEAPEETPNVELLRSEIKKAETPEELTRLHSVVSNLPAADKKSLSITVTTRGKNMGWVPNVELKCWEVPKEPAAETKDEKPTVQTPEANGTQEQAPAESNAPSAEEKPLFDQLAGATDENILHEIYNANTERIKASAPLAYIFQLRFQEIIEGAIMDAFAKAGSRNDLRQVYLEHQREIQKSPILTNLYEEARSKFPAEVSDAVAHRRSLEWFTARVGKTVNAHGTDDDGKPYMTPYKIVDATYPEAMFGYQDSGYLFSEPMTIPEGEKLD